MLKNAGTCALTSHKVLDMGNDDQEAWLNTLSLLYPIFPKPKLNQVGITPMHNTVSFFLHDLILSLGITKYNQISNCFILITYMANKITDLLTK